MLYLLLNNYFKIGCFKIWFHVFSYISFYFTCVWDFFFDTSFSKNMTLKKQNTHRNFKSKIHSYIHFVETNLCVYRFLLRPSLHLLLTHRVRLLFWLNQRIKLFCIIGKFLLANILATFYMVLLLSSVQILTLEIDILTHYDIFASAIIVINCEYQLS